MTIVDLGSGPPVILVPGIQGRWEWLRPAVDALARGCRVVTFSLADEPSAHGHFDATDGFASYVEQVAAAMDAAGIDRAVICGVSYGGLIAAAFAARHPDRVSGLVLTSALPPSWSPDARVRFYLRAPVLLSPLFFLASIRMYREIAAASTGISQSLARATSHGVNVIGHMFSPSRMARRVRMLRDLSLASELAAVDTPTLVITGEPHLDRVVPVQATRQYMTLWPHAEAATLERTGHLGSITRPDEFARLVTQFVGSARSEMREARGERQAASGEPTERRRIG
jgi:pimeloyl-ACP methyl ester carboxylesterase